MEKLYKENKHIIEAMAKKIIKMSHLKNDSNLLDELISEGNLVFVECTNKFQKRKGLFSKYLSTNLYYRLLRYCKREQDQINHLFDNFAYVLEETIVFLDKDPLYFLTEGLSEDGKIIVEKALELFPQKGKKLEVLYKYFSKVFGWSRRRTLRGFYEVRDALGTV